MILADDLFQGARPDTVGQGARGAGAEERAHAVRAFTPWAFERYDLLRLWAGVFETNPASARVLEKAGYAFEGQLRRAVVKDGKVLDELIYARLRDAR